MKVGKKVLQKGDEIKNFRFFKPQNKKALINSGRVEVVEDEENGDGKEKED